MFGSEKTRHTHLFEDLVCQRAALLTAMLEKRCSA